MDSATDERPAKKARIEATDATSDIQSKSKQPRKWKGQQAEYKRQQRRDDINHPQPESSEHRRDRELFGIDEDYDKEIGLKPLQDEGRKKLRQLHVPKMFSQPAVLAPGDKGIFVTCDKGREKKCLTELADLVEEYLEQHDIIPAELVDPSALLEARVERQQKKSATINVDNEESPVEEEEIDIESSITAELSGMQSPRHDGPDSHQSSAKPVNVRAFQLITLDVPCVSFLRFVPSGPLFEKIDVVDVVHSICADAAKSPGRMRSRFIKRLSPVVYLGKVLSGGLEKSCNATLPAWFNIKTEKVEKEGVEVTGQDANEHVKTGVKFAIRPTIRNNDKLHRDEVIKKVAEEVQRLGNGQHKVDLKGYTAGILVEVYRSWIGMSVVDNTASAASNEEDAEKEGGYGFGYEALKRFNLAEIYAEGLKKGSQNAPVEEGGENQL